MEGTILDVVAFGLLRLLDGLQPISCPALDGLHLRVRSCLQWGRVRVHLWRAIVEWHVVIAAILLLDHMKNRGRRIILREEKGLTLSWVDLELRLELGVEF